VSTLGFPELHKSRVQIQRTIQRTMAAEQQPLTPIITVESNWK